MHSGTCHYLACMIESLCIPTLFWSAIFNGTHVHVVYTCMYWTPSNLWTALCISSHEL